MVLLLAVQYPATNSMPQNATKYEYMDEININIVRFTLRNMSAKIQIIN